MKKLILLLAGLLSGCTLLDAYLMKYDSNEYFLVEEIRTAAQLAKDKCNTPEDASKSSLEVYKLTTEFSNYAQFLPHNDRVKNAAEQLNKMSQGLKDQYQNNPKVSAAFCKIKFENIEISAKTIQQTVGAKPR